MLRLVFFIVLCFYIFVLKLEFKNVKSREWNITGVFLNVAVQSRL
jgi:hypothetical protein